MPPRPDAGAGDGNITRLRSQLVEACKSVEANAQELTEAIVGLTTRIQAQTAWNSDFMAALQAEPYHEWTHPSAQVDPHIHNEDIATADTEAIAAVVTSAPQRTQPPVPLQGITHAAIDLRDVQDSLHECYIACCGTDTLIIASSLLHAHASEIDNHGQELPLQPELLLPPLLHGTVNC